jgi:hypothetical protein
MEVRIASNFNPRWFVDTVFLICSERSGSNLITRMVDNHPQFCGPSPTHLIRLLVQHRFAYGDWDDLCADAAELLATKIGEWRTQPTARDLAAVEPRTLTALLRHVFEGEARACGKERLFIKENHTARLLPFLLSAWPDARFVYLVRDPRDMALSWKRSAVHRGDVVRASREWQQDQAEGIAAIAQFHDTHRLHCLSYEDLVVVPELELLRLCRFLNVRFCPAMLEYHRAPETIANAQQTAAWENLARPVMTDNTRKWRGGLDNTEIALVEAVCAQEMAFFGYQRESTDPRTLAELEAELLPFERHDKPGYRDLPAAERSRRARREMLERRIAAREADPVPVA